MRYPFCCCKIPINIPQKPFCDWWHMFNYFPSTCAVDFITTHGKNKTRRFDTEGFVLVSILCVIIGSASRFIKCLIGIIGNIWWVMYINAENIHPYKTHACTIIECAIVCNVCNITSTWPLIYWWSSAANISCTPRTERPSWRSLDVNCMSESGWIQSKYHQPNSSTFPHLAWNISSLYITSSVVMFYIP